MAPSRRRNNTSLFESSTIITANLIMASSSYLLSRIHPRAPAPPPEPSSKVAATASTAWSSAAQTRSMEPKAGCRTVLMEADDGGYGKVDKEAEIFIKRFRERTHSEAARQDAASRAAVRPPQLPVAATKWAGTVHRFR
ncbi:hypothetical protein PR202_ga16785 [Eleusine coracana subsp. coracana]|uniref:Uncharacterized protein n=1 Tax=Eleusine coracana subsp. coracana TaxID=191504 RepID=A0AAV5CP45_ELECO|nr:hypothetical protein QOZ80_6AG0524450 [Eleusine coracana subsp. coracana]GJM99664.1 hypothetical protein PR202_ga16785 [Eleusine coracana subsp. coracana]